eukprot:15147754-Heterocapsa_arctica.AAC.1
MRKRKDARSLAELHTVKNIKTTTSKMDNKLSGPIDRLLNLKTQDGNPANLIPNQIPSLGMAIPGTVLIPREPSCHPASFIPRAMTNPAS